MAGPMCGIDGGGGWECTWGVGRSPDGGAGSMPG